jgi:hypothetical protein
MLQARYSWRIGLPFIIATPADDLLLWIDTACMKVPGGDFTQDGVLRDIELPLLVLTPAEGQAIVVQGAHVRGASRDLGPSSTWRWHAQIGTKAMKCTLASDAADGFKTRGNIDESKGGQTARLKLGFTPTLQFPGLHECAPMLASESDGMHRLIGKWNRFSPARSFSLAVC